MAVERKVPIWVSQRAWHLAAALGESPGAVMTGLVEKAAAEVFGQAAAPAVRGTKPQAGRPEDRQEVNAI